MVKIKLPKLKSMRVGSYLRELSIVIVGILVTFGTNNIINGIREQKDLQQQLSAIYSELEDNLEKIDKLTSYYDGHELLRNYLHQVIINPELANADSLKKYSYVVDHIIPFSYKKGAYEMFVYSGAMRSLYDKKLLQNITESYIALELTKEGNDKNIQLRLQQFHSLYSLNRNNTIKQGYTDLFDPRYINLFNYHTLTGGGGSLAKDARKHIEKVLSYRKQ